MTTAIIGLVVFGLGLFLGRLSARLWQAGNVERIGKPEAATDADTQLAALVALNDLAEQRAGRVS